MSKIINFLKKIPIDLGQGNLRFTTKGKLIAEALIPATDVSLGKKGLDIGCREGFQSEKLKSIGYDVTSIDIEKCYEHCIVMDANRPLAFPDEYFDMIWCSEVIEHLYDPISFRNECHRLLKNGGVLILTTPNSYFWFYYFMRLFKKSPKDLQNPDHKQFFSFQDIKNIFPDAKIYGYFPYFLIKLKITRLIGLLSPTFVVHLEKNKL